MVIMAGGIGSRFWPLSTESKPKQFQDFLGTGKSLIRMSFDRFAKFCPAENILVVSNAQYYDLIQEHIPELPSQNIISEPFRRNTAPCIALASLRINHENPKAKVIVSPADHLILEQDKFEESLEHALKAAEEHDQLVTIGIKPSRPDTGYGYIDFNQGNSPVREVNSFTEKPKLEKAQEFLKAGNYYWNSGMFIWQNQSILNSFEALLPQLLSQLKQGEESVVANNAEGIAAVFGACEDISIDYGIMEKSKNVKVVLGDFSWTDLGTWGSVYDELEKDSDANASIGQNIKHFNTVKNSLVVNEEKEKLIALMDIDNLIIVNTSESLLICNKDSEQGIKAIVQSLKD